MPADRYADCILVGGSIITMESKKPRVEAVSIKDGKFLRVGTATEVQETKGKRTEVKSIRGLTVVPGFVESHNHTLVFGLNQRGVDLSQARSIPDIIQLLGERANQLPESAWVLGVGYNQHELVEKKHPTRWDLDRVATSHPIAIKHTSAHARVVNSRGLELAGITRDTPDPHGGRIMRDQETGEPSGVLFQFSAIHLVERLMPAPSHEALIEALAIANRVLLSQGITSATDGGTHLVDIPSYLHAFKDAVRRSALRVRHNLAIRSELLLDYERLDEELRDIEEKLQAMKIRTFPNDERLRIGPFKCISDGAISTATAATYEPYGSDPEHLSTGEMMIEPETLGDLAVAGHGLGFQLMMHAIGDRAVDASIRAIDRALREVIRRDPRPRLEHCVMVPPEAVAEMKRLGIIAVMQPAFLWGLGDNWISQLGKERATKLMPFRSLLENRVTVAFGSDRPVVHGAPLLGIHASVNRKTMHGNDYAPEQGISAQEALRCYTLDGAYASFEEDIKGSIEAGKLADLVLLSDDPTQVPAEKIKDISVVGTVVGGELCYGVWR